MIKTLITGSSGFTGQLLNKKIRGQKILIDINNKRNIKEENSKFIKCDLIDYNAISDVIKSYKPEKIYHLAGSFSNDYNKDFSINYIATKNILDSVKKYSFKSKVLLVGSAAEYGLLKKGDSPVDENFPLTPNNAYGFTKILQKTMMDYYFNVHKLKIVMARPFNLFGQGISTNLFVGKVYQQIDLYKRGKIKNIKLGNLDSKRDYLPIADAIKHYIRIMNYGVSGEVYNVGSGKPIKTSKLLSIILKKEKVDYNVIISNTRNSQSNDSDCIYANINKLKNLYNNE